jgi:hypothetical protein
VPLKSRPSPRESWATSLHSVVSLPSTDSVQAPTAAAVERGRRHGRGLAQSDLGVALAHRNPPVWRNTLQDADYDQDFVTIANAQLDAFEMFALEHCKDNLEPEQAAVCAELRKEALELQRQLDIEVAANMSGDKKHRDHQWNIFGVDPSSVRAV